MYRRSEKIVYRARRIFGGSSASEFFNSYSRLNSQPGSMSVIAILRQQSSSPTVATRVRAADQRVNGCTMLPVFEAKRKSRVTRGADSMGKKRITLLLAAMVVFLPSMSALAQTSARWEGIVSRSNKQKSTLTVRTRGFNNVSEKVIHYDSSTRFTSQEHAAKKINDIDANQVNDGDRVICLGYYDEKGEFQAASISKRLSH